MILELSLPPSMPRETLRRIEPMRTCADNRQLATHKTPAGHWYVYERCDPSNPEAWMPFRGPFSTHRAAAQWIRRAAV